MLRGTSIARHSLKLSNFFLIHPETVVKQVDSKMAHRSPYFPDRRPMAMAGFGRGTNFNQEQSSTSRAPYRGRGRERTLESAHHSSEAANRWAASVRESSGVSTRPSLANDVLEKHVDELERIWTDERLLDKKKKSQAISKKLAELMPQCPNPWEVALRLVCGASDFDDAKASSLAFTILLEFRNWTSSPGNRMKDTSEEESCLSQELRVQVYNTFTGRHMAFFQVASRAFRLNHAGNEYFLPMIRPLLQQNKLTEVTELTISSKYLPDLAIFLNLKAM